MTKDLLASDQFLDQLRAGNAAAVREWYRQFGPPVRRFVLSKVSNERDAEEIVQDVFVSCLDSLPLFHGGSSLQTWMFSVAKHEVADYFRKKYAKRVLQSIPFADALLPTQLHNMHTVSAAVQRVLSRMSMRDREVLMLKYVDGAGVKEIAGKFKVSFKSAESLLFRARKLFRVMYAEEEHV
ncbi:MAG TPA: RNA polymerase sigma factor [Candidatus Saccharimonadia bacterium]|nr:RNA polymerase sigma factor [Candidatus Saccharimonadia bacterium]